MAPANASKIAQANALKLLALAAMVTLLWIAHPVGVGLFLGILVAFTLQPLYGRLRMRKWSAGSAALVCALGALVLVTGAFAGFAALFITRGVTLAQAAPGLLAPGGALRQFAEHTLTSVHVNPDATFARLQEQAMSLGTRAAGIAAGVAGATFSGALTIFFMTLAAYYVLRHWDEIVQHAERVFPFAPHHTRALFGQFRKVGSEVLRGTVVTGVIQGVFAGVGYWITGFPDPAFFGALTAVASIVPAVGTLLVWIPAGIYLMVTGHVAGGVVELVWGALITGILTDYVIRPKLVQRGTGVPTILTFISLFGGIEVFGFIGLIVGPVIVTLCVAILKTYEAEVGAAGAAGVVEDVKE
jgi:predicted PurR-regulated permease PerM